MQVTQAVARWGLNRGGQDNAYTARQRDDEDVSHVSIAASDELPFVFASSPLQNHITKGACKSVKTEEGRVTDNIVDEMRRHAPRLHAKIILDIIIEELMLSRIRGPRVLPHD